MTLAAMQKFCAAAGWTDDDGNPSTTELRLVGTRVLDETGEVVAVEAEHGICAQCGGLMNESSDGSIQCERCGWIMD
jgi:hypothetical protein